jgi:hypothetical protein
MYLPEWAQKFKEPKTEIRIIGGHCYNAVKLHKSLLDAETLKPAISRQ